MSVPTTQPQTDDDDDEIGPHEFEYSDNLDVYGCLHCGIFKHDHPAYFRRGATQSKETK